MGRASAFACSAASGREKSTPSRNAWIDAVGNWTSHAPSRQCFSAFTSSGSNVSARRSATVASPGSSPIARYPGVPLSRHTSRAAFKYVSGDPSTCIAPNTYTSDGSPHGSTFATGRPASIAAISSAVSPNPVKIGNGGVRATRCALTLKTRSNAYRRMADPQFPFQGIRATIATQGSATVTPRPAVRITPEFASLTLGACRPDVSCLDVVSHAVDATTTDPGRG